MDDEKAIRFTAQVSKVQTMADGGLRVILDMPETAIDTATRMMQVKQAGAILEIVALPVILQNPDPLLEQLRGEL